MVNFFGARRRGSESSVDEKDVPGDHGVLSEKEVEAGAVPYFAKVPADADAFQVGDVCCQYVRSTR